MSSLSHLRCRVSLYLVGTLVVMSIFPAFHLFAQGGTPEVTAVQPNQGNLGQRLRVDIWGRNFAEANTRNLPVFGEGIVVERVISSSSTRIPRTNETFLE